MPRHDETTSEDVRRVCRIPVRGTAGGRVKGTGMGADHNGEAGRSS